MILLLLIAKWAGLGVAGFAIGWTVGGHVDGISAAGIAGLIVAMIAMGALDRHASVAVTEADLSRLDRLDGVGSGR